MQPPLCYEFGFPAVRESRIQALVTSMAALSRSLKIEDFTFCFIIQKLILNLNCLILIELPPISQMRECRESLSNWNPIVVVS